jgi:predicted Zn-dependent peptidase
MEQKDPGVYLFLAVCNPNIDALEVEKIIWDEIEKIKQGDVKKSEIEKVKINTKSDFVFSLESSSDVASLYGSYLIRGDISPLMNYEENLDNVTLKDIANVAKKYLQKDNSTTLILKKD